MGLKAAARQLLRSVQKLKRRLLYGTVGESELRQLIAQMAPEWPRDVVRIGREGDGGYVIPNDLEGVACCFSPGVGRTAEFELDLQRRYGIPSFLADYSVDGPPAGIDPKFFTKAFIGHGDHRFLDFGEWVDANAPPNQELILQMDIEGGEYDVLRTADVALLKRFRIIVVEFHDLHRLSDRRIYVKFSEAVHRLLPHFRVVHIHPNNNGAIGKVGSIECPRLLEITFARRDRHYDLETAPAVPHPLDRKNVNRPDIVLPAPWRGIATSPGVF